MKIIFSLGLVIILFFLALLLVFRARPIIRADELSSAERQFKMTSLGLSALSVIASAFFAASSLYVAISAYEYESNDKLGGEAEFYLQSEGDGTGWAQVEVEIHNEGGASALVDKVVINSSRGEEVEILPAGAYVETANGKYDEFGVKSFSLEPGSTKTFRVRIDDVQDSSLAGMTVAGCAVYTVDGEKHDLGISFMQGFASGPHDYCSAFATPFHAPLLQRSMADCHTLTI